MFGLRIKIAMNVYVELFILLTICVYIISKFLIIN
jgi:hypothetical protein